MWQLQGNAILTSPLPLPATLTINGATAGSTITLNNGTGAQGYFVGPSSPSITTLALSNVTITGADNVGSNTVGGAISGPFTQRLTIPITGSVTFSENRVTGIGSGGAAIYAGNSGMTPSPGSVSIENAEQASSSSVTFSNNTVTATASGGGAIAARGGVSIGTKLSPLASVTFTGNTTADFLGGAIYAASGDVNIYGNAITLSRNASGSAGGAIFAQGKITLTGNTITASSNSAVVSGGALEANNDITISGNSIVLSNNVVIPSIVGGGAIHLGGTGPVLANLLIDGSNEVIFSNNTAAFGGAISGSGNVLIDGSTITLSGNTARTSVGGAIATFGGNVSIGTGSSGFIVDIIGNTASSAGGAIFTTGNVSIGNSGSTVNITGNSGNVTLSQNMAGTSGGGDHQQRVHAERQRAHDDQRQHGWR
jgi:filamentous hemagglutinin